MISSKNGDVEGAVTGIIRRVLQNASVFPVGLAIAAILALTGWPSCSQASETAPIEIRVVVVTTFEVGNDTGDTPGEFQNWVEHYPLADKIPFPQGFRDLRYNAKDHVLGVVTGEGKSHAAASIMALGLDPRFDFSRAYWILAGIAGIDPALASVGSAAWASNVVDGDLGYEIDGREIPAGWATGIVPFDRSAPFQPPTPPAVSSNGVQVYHLNEGLVTWAYNLTSGIKLPDDDRLLAARKGYPDCPNGQKPPFVIKGDTLTADRFWIGADMTAWARQWISYWTHNTGQFATTAEEDTGFLQALTFLSQTKRADLTRVLDLRTGSDFSLPPKNVSAAAFLKTEATGDYAAYAESVQAAYLVGSPVVRELASRWAEYSQHVPVPKP